MVGFCYVWFEIKVEERERERIRCKRVERRNLSVKTQTGPGEKMGYVEGGGGGPKPAHVVQMSRCQCYST